MKFGKRMQEEMLEHWAAYYVSYKRLKQLCIRSPLRGERFTTELFKVIREELKKAEDHFRTLLEELTVQHDTLVASEQLDRDSPVAPRGTPHNFAGSFFPQRKSKRRHHKSGDEALQGTEMTNAGNTSITEINASFPEGNNSGYSSVDNEQQHASAPKPWERNEDEGLCSKIMSPMKSVFMRIISQSTRSAEGSGDIRVLRSQFIEWYASAHRLEHFAELNLEALRKTLKKLVKHRGEEGDFTNAVEAEIAMSPLSTLLPKLHQMSTMISQDFHRRFDEPLDMYKDLVMNTKEQWHAKWRFVLLSAIVFGAAMSSPIFVEHTAAHKCFALFALVVTMWITEAIPFFCTAMLIPIVAVPLGILRDPTSGEVASPVISSRIMLSHVFDHVQILVLGGLTIAKALSKVRLEDVAASWLHHHTAHRPSLYLLGVMVLSCLLCSFVSNVAAPLLVLGVIQKTLWEFPSDTNAPKAILLGLAIACNLGGMLSPIASPQNAVALQVLTFHNVSFSSWVAISLPLVAVALLGAWWLLLWWFNPFEHVSYIPLQVTSTHNANIRTPRSVETIFVVTVSLITVVLWCLPASLLFGDTGIIALIPIVLFFGVGVLKKEDFNTLSWHLMFLLAGGNMLGVCARDSHMVDLVASLMEAFVASQSAYVTVAVVICSVGLVTTFVSHTVAAMILLPIVAKIGFMLPAASAAGHSGAAAVAVASATKLGHHVATTTLAPAVAATVQHHFSWHSLFTAGAISPATLVFLSVLMCSGAMAFPISSFPNVNSLLAEDEFGKPYLAARDFLGIGTVITLFLVVSLATWMLPLTALFI